jgi:hypothetical protein
MPNIELGISWANRVNKHDFNEIYEIQLFGVVPPRMVSYMTPFGVNLYDTIQKFAPLDYCVPIRLFLWKFKNLKIFEKNLFFAPSYTSNFSNPTFSVTENAALQFKKAAKNGEFTSSREKK